ncbi:CDP-alcohol phosphatidyltransferase family protein [Candidatus Fermentibacteria bacterium]|nr:CDP-alcohol phosphatidyltransferase family protein [Candidatus Fermentibacteria bacterium]
MAANMITLGRILLVFVVVIMFQGGFTLRIAALAMTIFVIWLDSLDGYVARKLNAASEVGALFDITGDRIVEHIYLIFYAAVGAVSFWVPMIFVTRSFLVDTLRTVAFSKEGKTPFGDKTMMRSPLTRFLTASRFSRAVYGVSKVVVFVLLGLELAFRQAVADGAPWLSMGALSVFRATTVTLVWIMVAFNLFRGIPVLWDGRTYLFDKYLPRDINDV